MAKKSLVVEFGMGTSLRRMDYTDAACRAVRDALWHNAVTIAEVMGVPREAMLLDAEIGVQRPDLVDVGAVAKEFPYGNPTVTVVHGGLDVPGYADGQPHVMANVAVTISFDLEPTTGARR